MCLCAVWVCTAALAILDRLDVVDVPTLGWWLAERQLPNGGMNGRPEKLEDVCIFFYIYMFYIYIHLPRLTTHRAPLPIFKNNEIL